MNLDVDLVVVGFGAAGAAAALTAARAGASVVILEKQPADRHLSSTRLSGGLMMTANDVEGATTYLDACADGMIPTEINRVWAERSVELQDWLADFGIGSVVMAGGWHPKLPGFEAIEVIAPLADGVDPASLEIELPAPGELTFKGKIAFGNGQLLHDLLVDRVSRYPAIQVLYGCAAERLVQTEGRISGVIAQGADGSVEVRARKGVVLASGGFEQDQEMILNYLKAYPVYFYGSKANTGDGIRMAQAVGADLWHMNQMIGRAVARFQEPDGTETTFSVSLNPPGYVIVDKYGERFANEYLQAVSKANFYFELLTYDADRLEYPRIPSYWIFDSRRLQARPLAHSGIGYYAWSVDNQAEIDLGWIKCGDTVQAAAAAAGCADPDAAAQTVEAYNAACASGADGLGRPASSLVPIDQGPFYCVPVYPGGATTNGGPRRDERARILDPYKRPIPGLYGAGELGGAIGLLYPSPGSNLSEALVFGAIAAETALQG